MASSINIPPPVLRLSTIFPTEPEAPTPSIPSHTHTLTGISLGVMGNSQPAGHPLRSRTFTVLTPRAPETDTTTESSGSNDEELQPPEDLGSVDSGNDRARAPSRERGPVEAATHATSVSPMEDVEVEPFLPTCPITLEPFEKPVLCLEDGFTYEEYAIRGWHAHSKTSPLNRAPLRTLTLLPNLAVLNHHNVCPITLEPFKQPYYLSEDGFTYEKDAILKWCETEIAEQVENGFFGTLWIRGPVSGKKIDVGKIVLWPNRLLYDKGDMPKKYEPVIFDPQPIIITREKAKERPCIFDPEIRGVLEEMMEKSQAIERRQVLEERFNALRKKHGLEVSSGIGPDLSYLDLSKMKISNLFFSDAHIRGANLSHTRFVRCDFSEIRISFCNCQNMKLIDCTLRGIYFYKNHFLIISIS
jgi:hypothetical protein